MSQSHSSNRATHGSSNRSHSPVSDSTVTGADAGNHHRSAVSDMSNKNGNVQPPPDRDDLAREIERMWNEGARLPAQMPRPSQAR
ncbi:hypothetical protein NW752_006547 [Fusarium irregulare]|uniref:Uncharacterized protein n=1 Tax=Fusarium irregulare TaxID=2494466 RepID=A0A9W8PSD3_9HYPO|nr:hypothetical protein NW766_005424 [Fusarium irregulare]KAJ4015626.1 hypothetical protein NW752_006547 [Fusarium irregulare]